MATGKNLNIASHHEQYTCPHPMQLPQTDDYACKISRLVTLLGTSSQPNFETRPLLDIKLKFIRKQMLPRTVPGPGYLEWETKLKKIGYDGRHISQPIWRRTHARCCKCRTSHPWKSCPGCNHFICAMCFDGVEHAKYPSYEKWLKIQEKQGNGYSRDENVEDWFCCWEC
ncbi:uncharacterized protein K444DRAFT_632529 [Hyaloscypha bicolor E]|uniref:Uncharacterized protein n=1 Tax=Hyaloscypha bicolor E TaxID=1095630 RepID=A0A2J6T326_9HELO|nr:uncharacterized protein K444DRAFT_632529 [Hyaloscypha bicolor E]PMD57434.1 hypothetical protein K444DRAFT_632529 [Hyaloscypha bicolor E]